MSQVEPRLAEVPAEQFFAADVRVATVTRCEDFPEARRPSFRLWLDAGPLGELRSAARLTDLYTAEQLIGRQVLCVVNLPARQVGPVRSEALILGVYRDGGEAVVLLQPERPCRNGDRVA